MTSLANRPFDNSLYTKAYPTPDDIDTCTLHELKQLLPQLEAEVGLLDEETRIFTNYLKAQKEKESLAVRSEHGEGDEAMEEVTLGAPSGKRRGRAYRRKSSDNFNALLPLEDKLAVLASEQEHLKVDKEKNDRSTEESREIIRATVEEAQVRISEVKMELTNFKREVASERRISADKVLKYFAERPAQKESVVAKLRDKCTALNGQVSKYQAQLRQREDVGEAFHTIDFDQLRIENQQFLERIDIKNNELVELKGTTTRTVQTLNSLTDKLNEMLSKQQRLKKDLKVREEHVAKLKAEIDLAQKEGEAAKAKNAALKVQHEAVKVPKVEDYIAQKAEMYELERAALNWRRKVEIASGHVNVMKQQMLSMNKQVAGTTTARAATSPSR